MQKKYKWYARLTYNNPVMEQTILNFLGTSLKEPSCTILTISGVYCLVSSDFESLTDAFDVLDAAHEKLTLLNSIVKLKFSPYPNFDFGLIRIDDVYHLNDEDVLIGEETRTYENRIPTKAFLETTDKQSPSLLELWLLWQKHPEIEEALHYHENSYNLMNLYKIYEVIKTDIKKLENSGKLPRETLSKWARGRNLDFEQSAHNAHISGKDAHHSFATSHELSGVNPMSLREAKEFIENLFLEWVKIKI